MHGNVSMTATWTEGDVATTIKEHQHTDINQEITPICCHLVRFKHRALCKVICRLKPDEQFCEGYVVREERLTLQTCFGAKPSEIYLLHQLWISSWHRTQTRTEQLSCPVQWSYSQQFVSKFNVRMSHRTSQLRMNAGRHLVSCNIRARKSRWLHLALV